MAAADTSWSSLLSPAFCGWTRVQHFCWYSFLHVHRSNVKATVVFSIELWALQSVTCCSIKKSAKPELIVSLHWALSWLVFKKMLNYFSFFFMCVLLPLERSQVALVFLCHMTWNWWPSVSAHLAWRLMIWALGSDGPGWNAKGYEHGNTYSVTGYLVPSPRSSLMCFSPHSIWFPCINYRGKTGW